MRVVRRHGTNWPASQDHVNHTGDVAELALMGNEE